MTGLVRILLRALAILITAFFVTLVAIVLLLAVGFRVPLDPLRQPMEQAASAALGRAVVIEGGIELVPAFAPTFQIEGVRVSDVPPSPDQDFLRADLARLRVRALPLAFGRIHIAELAAEGIALNLHRGPEGAVNWVFGGAESGSAAPPQPAGDKYDFDAFMDEFGDAIQIVGLDELLLRGIAVRYKNEPLDQDLEFVLDESTGILLAHESLHLVATGSIQGEEYRVSLDGDAPQGLLDPAVPWGMKIRFELARTVLELDGHLEGDPFDPSFWDTRVARQGTIVAELSLRGERVSDLAPFFSAALPPLGPYRISGTVDSRGIRSSIPDLVISVGGSELRGALWADYLEGARPRAEMKLAVDALQLDDFDFGDWSPFAGAAPRQTATAAAPPGAAARGEEDAPPTPIEIPSLLSREVMGRADGHLKIDVKSVHSGQERLGGAHLEMRLEQGRLELSSLEIEVPGGAFELSAAYEPTEAGIEAEIRAQIDRLDYGVLARRVAPETRMAGEISLDVGLRSSTPSVEAVMANASGFFDFAVWPRGFESGIFDLWAVNLVSAVIPAVEGGKRSEIHCIVGLFDIADGRMEEKGIAVDTTRMRVAGEAVVDFREKTVELELAPRPKKPEFFSAATPIHVQGSFSDFDVGVRPEDLIGTVIRFVTSVVVVPLQRIFEAGKLGSEEACSEALDAADRPKTF